METIFDKIKRFPKRAIRTALIRTTSIDSKYKGVEKQCVIPERIIQTPEVKEMSFYSDAKYLEKSFYCVPKGELIKLDRAIYKTGQNVLTTSSNEILLESVNADRFRYVFSLTEAYFSNPDPLRVLQDGYYSVFRSTQNNYYHTLIDNLPRLYLLGKFADSPIKLLFPGKPTPVESFFLDRLKPPNVVIELVEPNKSYLVEKLILPSFLTRHYCGYLPEEYIAHFRKCVLPKRPRKKVNRIFIARGPNHTNPRRQRRRFLNEDAVFRELEKYGFKKYILEDLSIDEQINLFYDAEFVVGAHGAGLTNIIFSEDIGVLELFANNCMLPYYYYLSKCLGHKYFYLYGDKSHIHADFTANIAEIAEIFDKIGLSRQNKDEVAQG